MLQDDEQSEGTQLFFGLLDKYRGTKRKMLDSQSTPSVAESPAEDETNEASRISEEEFPEVQHTYWSLWMGPGFSDSEEEEEKGTTAHISYPSKMLKSSNQKRTLK